MSYPSDLPVHERVVAHLVETLAAMAPPATVHTFRSVERWGGGSVQKAPAYPAAIVIPVVETSDDQAILPLLRHELDVAVTMTLRDQDWKTAIQQLAADVRVAVLADYSRGGDAETTRVISTEVFPPVPNSPLAAAQVNLRVVYRTLYTDPSEAH